MGKKPNPIKLAKSYQEQLAAKACERYYNEYGAIDDRTLARLNNAIDELIIKNEDAAYAMIVLSEESLKTLDTK